jgi:hypothetical protein
VLVEFAVNDYAPEEEVLTRSIEGIVRALRSSGTPDLCFLYFSYASLHHTARMQRALAAWERIAEHYGVPSIDVAAIANECIASGGARWIAPWESDRAALTRDGVHLTLDGGRILGEAVAKLIARTIDDTASAAPALPEPLDPEHYAGARFVPPSQVDLDGWDLVSLADKWCAQKRAVYFNELAEASRIGGTARYEFTGRRGALIFVGNGARLRLRFDGATLGEFALPGDDGEHIVAFFEDRADRQHRIEVEALSVPAFLAGLNVIGAADPEASAKTGSP